VTNPSTRPLAVDVVRPPAGVGISFQELAYLELEDLLAAAAAALGREPVIRDWGLLSAALARPRASAFGEPAYPDLSHKAAALLDSLARSHTLVDGNKRLAWVATRLFFVFNGLDLRAPSVDEGERFMLAVATGTLEVSAIAAILAAWIGPPP
jgi:death on curing protein